MNFPLYGSIVIFSSTAVAMILTTWLYILVSYFTLIRNLCETFFLQCQQLWLQQWPRNGACLSTTLFQQWVISATLYSQLLATRYVSIQSAEIHDHTTCMLERLEWCLVSKVGTVCIGKGGTLPLLGLYLTRRTWSGHTAEQQYPN